MLYSWYNNMLYVSVFVYVLFVCWWCNIFCIFFVYIAIDQFLYTDIMDIHFSYSYHWFISSGVVHIQRGLNSSISQIWIDYILRLLYYIIYSLYGTQNT